MKLRAVVFAGMFTGAVLAAERPNVIFLLCDDLGYADVGYMQKKQPVGSAGVRIATPNLDALAARAAVLTDHYCAAPVCAPSRASIMTGRLQRECSLQHNQFDKPIAETKTLGTVMKAAGYETYAVGKWGIGGGGESGYPVTAHPLDRGFDHYYGFMDHRAGHTYYHWDGYWGHAYMGVWEDRVKATETAAGRYSTDLFIARAKKYIETQLADVERKDNPFFMYLAINAIHGSGQGHLNPTLPAGRKQNLHVPGVPYRAHRNDDGTVMWPIPAEPAEVRNTYKYDGPACSTNYYGAVASDAAKRYAAGITRLDEAVGDLVDFLKEQGIDRNTIIIFTSDNGPAAEYGADPAFFRSNGRFYGKKRDVYEGGMRIPAFVYWPGRTENSGEIDAPSISCDWLAALERLGREPDRVPIPESKELSSLYHSVFPASYDGVFLKSDGTPSEVQRPTGGLQHWERKGTTVYLQAGGKDRPVYVFEDINGLNIHQDHPSCMQP